MHNLRTIATSLLVIACLAGTPAAATTSSSASPRELQWSDLVPPINGDLQRQAVEMDKKLRALPKTERELYDEVALELLLRDEIAAGQLKRSSLSEREKRTLNSGSANRHPKIAAFWGQYEKIRKAFERQAEKVRPDLHETNIRMPGYVLPLEFDGDMVREFLLVPYVGACIHAPAPPTNQMVFVKVSEPFRSDGLFAPVWVEGKMLAKPGTHNLSLVDGSRDVESGYTISARTVTPYKR